MDPLYFHDLEQGTPAWHSVRAGAPTASNFKTLLANGRGGKPSAARRTYALDKAWERITHTTKPVIETWATRRGHEVEAILFDQYAFLSPEPVAQCGFIRNAIAGYSPDGLVGADGLVEFKSHEPSIGLPMVLSDEPCPEDHAPQVYGGLWVSDRDWCDLVISVRGFPAFTRRVYRDDAVIAEIAKQAAVFDMEVDAIVEEIEARYGASAAELRAIGGAW